MARQTVYQPRYRQSWALVIGINDYVRCSQLEHARNDANAVADVLVTSFQFSRDNVTVLLDAQASRTAILDALLVYAETDRVHPNDRLLVFFAGHGETVAGNRGDVGYLVPADGDCDKLATLIRWDELTRNADMIPAKHVLFIMDACYGGLAVKRHVPPGGRRFLSDMLRRYTRQVLTAGKDDELVADSGGPRPGHSVFTGHLLEALEGKAKTKSGLITANAVMAYVYDRVSTDHHSQQTPHYGFIDGDGDFVFSALPDDGSSELSTKVIDTVVEVPADLIDQKDAADELGQLAAFKEYLAEPRHRIKLDDSVNTNIRAAIHQTSDDKFSPNDEVRNGEHVAARLKAYEDVIRPVQAKAILLGKWVAQEQKSTLANIMARLADNCVKPLGGSAICLSMRWYPLSLLAYSAGISALSADNYPALAAVHLTRVDARTRRLGSASVPILVPIGDAMADLGEYRVFRCLLGYDRYYAPESEYLFKTVQPVLEDLLFLGASYERLFDRYEILRAWLYADLTDGSWAPVGRFGWKSGGPTDRNGPYGELRFEAEQQCDNWPPLKAGLFRGQYARFQETVAKFEKEVLDRIHWR
ncbi:MAG: caspase domain-containing protein [Gemmataceae bacterium]